MMEINLSSVELSVGLKLIDIGVDPKGFRIEQYRDSHSFATIVRAWYVTEDNTLGYSVTFTIKDSDVVTEEVIIDRIFYAFRERLYPDRHQWLIELTERIFKLDGKTL